MDIRKLPQHINTAGLVAYYKLDNIVGEAKVFDYSQNGFTGVLSGTDIAPAYPGFKFNGTDDYIDVGAGPSVAKTVLFWYKPTTVIARSEIMIDLNGTDYISLIDGTLTGAGFGASPVRYVDGVEGETTVTANWHLLGVTNSVAMNASDFDIGQRNNAFYCSGVFGEIMIFDTVKTTAEIKSVYEITRWRYSV